MKVTELWGSRLSQSLVILTLTVPPAFGPAVVFPLPDEQAAASNATRAMTQADLDHLEVGGET